MIRGAIFDIDGTVLDSMLFWKYAPEPFLKNIGLELEPDVGQATLFKSIQEIAEILKTEYNIETSEDAIISEISGTIKKFYKYDVRLKEGVGQFITDLKKAGIKITAATFSERQNVENALKRLGVIKYFDRIFTCAEIGAGKEKPDIYMTAAGFMGTTPEETWVFEDALYAVKTAKNAGFRTAGVYDPTSEEYAEELKTVSDIYFEKFNNSKAFLDFASGSA